MNVSSKRQVRALFFCAAFAVIVLTAAANVWAQQAIATPDVQAMTNQPFHGMAVTTEVSGKRYLYVHNETAPGVSVVDITDPSQPKALGFLTDEGRWTKTNPAGKANRQADPDNDAPQNHIEYGGG